MTQAREIIDIMYGPPLAIISDCLRGFLAAKPGHDLIACDFTAIEARIVAWLAGETRILKLFEEGDVYVSEVSGVFGIPIESVSKAQRQIGKVIVLAFGFGGGVGALQTMARSYNVTFEPFFSVLWGRAEDYHREKAENLWSKNKEKSEISREEFIASDLTKQFWREKNTNIVDLWYRTENAAIMAVQNEGAEYSAGENIVTYKKAGSFLFCRLPSGRVLTYPYPKLEEVMTPWGEKKQGLTYMAEDATTRKWSKHKAYGGLLVENNTQAVSRDLLVNAIFKLRAKNYPTVIHVHDEVVVEVPVSYGSVEEVERLATQKPEWAHGLPIKAEGWRGKRYRK